MIAVLDYEMGNIGSVVNMIRKLHIEIQISRDRKVLEQSKGLILPGVGSFDQGMKQLKKFDLISILNDLVVFGGKPFLGICLGCS